MIRPNFSEQWGPFTVWFQLAFSSSSFFTHPHTACVQSIMSHLTFSTHSRLFCAVCTQILLFPPPYFTLLHPTVVISSRSLSFTLNCYSEHSLTVVSCLYSLSLLLHQNIFLSHVANMVCLAKNILMIFNCLSDKNQIFLNWLARYHNLV